MQNYYKKVFLGFNFKCHGNKTLNQSKGLQTSKKRLNLFMYFKYKTFPNGILFSQETHSTKESEIKWKDKFDGNLYYSHGKSNSYDVLIGLSSNKTLTVKKRLCDENGWLLILERLLDGSEFILINFYNAHKEGKQIQTFNKLNILLSNLDLSSEKHIISASDFNLFLDCSLDPKGASPSLKNTFKKRLHTKMCRTHPTG